MKRSREEEKNVGVLVVSEEVKLRTLLVARAMNVDVNELLTTLLSYISAPTIEQVAEVITYA
jgi:hypothetical protein